METELLKGIEKTGGHQRKRTAPPRLELTRTWFAGCSPYRAKFHLLTPKPFTIEIFLNQLIAHFRSLICITMTNTAESPKSAPTANNEAPTLATVSPRHCAPKLNTKDRLFGTTPASPKIVKNTATFKSNIFGNEPPSSPAKASKKPIAVIERNPVTGEVKIPPRVTV